MQTSALEFIRRAAITRRYHCYPTLREQSVGEHSYQVAWLVTFLSPTHPSSTLLLAALSHDAAEWVMGDLPAPSKRSLPDYPNASFRDVWGALEEELLQKHGLDYGSQLTEEEALVLKLADAAEGALHCCTEVFMGNGYMKEVYGTFREYYKDLHSQLTMPSDVQANANRLYNYIESKWRQANG